MIPKEGKSYNMYLKGKKKKDFHPMSQEIPQKILAGRRVAIPKEMFEKSQLNDGGIVLVSQAEDGTIQIKPAEVKARILTT